MAWIEVAKVEEIKPNSLKSVKVGDDDVVLVGGAHCDSPISAFTDLCSHQDVKLSEFGSVTEGKLVCFAHNAAFDVCSGEVVCAPATRALDRWDLEIRGASVFVKRR